MPKFIYKAQNAQGLTVSGFIEAKTYDEAMGILSLKNFSKIDIREKRMSIFDFFIALNDKIEKSTSSKKVKLQELAIMSRQLATLVDAGVSLLDAVSEVSSMVQNKYFSSVLLNICDDIKAGQKLSTSIEKYKNIFDNTYISLVNLGEKTGNLGKVFIDLADYLESNVRLIRKIKSASSYPIFVGVFFVVVFCGIVFILIPKFQDMFASFGATLPLPTMIIMNFSNFLLDKIWIVIVFVLVCFISFKSFIKTSVGLMVWHKFLFKIPIFAPIYTKMLFARFFHTLSALVQSGVDIVESIQIASNSVANVYIKDLLRQIKDSVVAGKFFSESMEKYKIFPKMAVKMVSVGEKTGNLEKMFSKISDYYNDEVDATVAGISSVIEPVLIIGLGLMVGICVVALYLPIFNMANAMVSANS